MRRFLVSGNALFLLVVLGWSPAAPLCASEKPLVRNILFIALEDWNASVLGAEGHPHVQTPRLDELASRGVRFTRAYCQGTVCNPSKASFLTGRYPTETGVLGNPEPFEPSLAQGVRTLPELLRNGRPDLRLGNVSKLCLQPVFAQRTLSAFHRLEMIDLPEGFSGVNRGFALPENLEPRNPGFQFTPDAQLDAQLSKASERREALDASTPKDAPNRWEIVEKEFQLLHSELVGDSGKSEPFEEDGQVARCAAQILEEWAPRSEPFFLSLTFAKPHTPLLAPREYVDLYNAESLPLPTALASLDVGIPDAAKRWGHNWDIFNQFEPTETRQRAALAGYYACASFIDAQVGLVLDALEKSGRADETAVIVFADHGFHLGEHGLWSKLTLFEQSTRVPMIIAVPGTDFARGQTCSSMVELVDFLPTVCELAGIKVPADVAGKSLVPLLRNPTLPHRDEAFSFLPIGGGGLAWSVRTRDHRYTEWWHPEGTAREFELYDLKSDPWEHRNLAGEADVAEIRAELAGRLENFRHRHPLRGAAAAAK